jgi:hypothetical protein
MHRLATTPGGWNPAAEGVIFVEQQPAPITGEKHLFSSHLFSSQQQIL